MSAFLEAAAVWLADFLVLTTVLLTASLLMRLVVVQPATRVVLAWSTWLGVLAIAVLTVWPSWPRYAIEDVVSSICVEATGSTLQPPADVAISEVSPFMIEPLVNEPLGESGSLAAFSGFRPTDVVLPDLTWPQLAVVSWSAIVIATCGWIGLGWFQAMRLIARAHKAPSWVVSELCRLVGAARLPTVWSSPRVSTAVALGAWSPQIVLPRASVAEANAPAIRAALAHEWAHIRHGDLWLLALERLLLPLLAVHPLFWWLRRSVRLDQELLADAAAAGNQPAEYAAALLAWAKTAEPARHGLAALSMWEHPSTLSRRVAMILNPQRRVAGPLGLPWMMAIGALALPAILALSVVSLQPSAAQEEPVAAAEPGNPLTRLAAEATVQVPAAGQGLPITQVHLEVLIMNVSRAKLAAVDTTLEDAIAEATESRCRKEAGLVVSEIKPEEVVKLLDGLQKHDAVTVLSRPQIVTLDGREANVHVGGEAPLLRVEETVNGKHERRVEYKEFGTMLMVRPKLTGENADWVTLDIVAEQSSLLPPGEKVEEGAVPRDVPGLVSHKFKLTSDVRLGGSLLVAESPADKKKLRDGVKQQFLLIITPQRAVRTVAAVYSDPRAGDKGEADRAATEAALQAATAAEPEPGTGAAVLLKAERDARAKETAALKRQIEALERALAARSDNPSDTTAKVSDARAAMTTVYRLRHINAVGVAQRLKEFLEKSPAKDTKFAVDETTNSVIVSGQADIHAEMKKWIFSLDRPDDNRALQTELKLLELDMAEAKLAVEEAEEDYARVQQLRERNAITQQEVRQKQLQVERAKIQMQRIMIKLEAAKEEPQPARK